VADVQEETNQALGITAAVSDLIGNKVVNVVDIQIVMNAALKLGCTQ
jgi:predicted amino acid-binding ACT domain protein